MHNPRSDDVFGNSGTVARPNRDKSPGQGTVPLSPPSGVENLHDPEGVWAPHVYFMLCKVNEDQLLIYRRLRNQHFYEPNWLTDVRWNLPDFDPPLLAQLRTRQFVKVGSTYNKTPTRRTTTLQAPRPNTTMECATIPVVGTEHLVYIPGEASLEFALHTRWDAQRIDPGREFFWLNEEIVELWETYRERRHAS